MNKLKDFTIASSMGMTEEKLKEAELKYRN